MNNPYFDLTPHAKNLVLVSPCGDAYEYKYLIYQDDPCEVLYVYEDLNQTGKRTVFSYVTDKPTPTDFEKQLRTEFADYQFLYRDRSDPLDSTISTPRTREIDTFLGEVEELIQTIVESDSDDINLVHDMFDFLLGFFYTNKNIKQKKSATLERLGNMIADMAEDFSDDYENK